jgi:hypothetical protein
VCLCTGRSRPHTLVAEAVEASAEKQRLLKDAAYTSSLATSY